MTILIAIFFLAALAFAVVFIYELMRQIRQLEEELDFNKGLEPEERCVAENKYLLTLYKKVKEHNEILTKEVERLRKNKSEYSEKENKYEKV